MNHHSWILLDTETNGIKAPIYVVEIGAQKMNGWLPDGPPFRRLLNHNANIPPEASRVNGYTREILERDGDDPLAVYQDFAAYVGDAPLVSYNLPFDLDRVLLPEWQRLNITPIGQRGFCALVLARRLLDPVPAGNCKLQTLRQFYRLPARGAHSALGDVETVVDLLDQVLRPLAEARGIQTWTEVLAFTEAPWFPSLIAFGKFKGRNFREAATDSDLHDWLQWLAGSSNARSASMGQWYLAQLEADAPPPAAVGVAASDNVNIAALPQGSAVVLYLSPQKAELQQLISAARNRLADLEADYTAQKHAVDVTLAQLFQALRPYYQRRDQLQLKINFRRQYLDVLMQAGDEEAEQVQQAHTQARQQTDAEYEQAATEAASKQALTEEEAQETKTIWRKLVRAFHPDRCMDDAEKRQAHEWLTAEINHARDRGDIQRLREIAHDPDAFLLQHGMAVLSQEDSNDVLRLRTLLDSLQQRILEILEALNDLHETSGYELHQRVQQNSDFFNNTVAEHISALEAEIAALDAEAAQLAEEIEGLTGVSIEND
ncbi:MAG: exonuclease domain-containing protein [Giesbergeria sp.]|uniref:exonuclease domain-containing protein n=1 Tax=Giesbergeria sp. TaxID=2818473 RepID=UPI002614BFE6|nr:exonuclease domain-containing protein [Giesbergeria sp.]MDD2610138.1 exonuclease domain-containing protein [Giesbergeria sp.]